MSAGEAFAAAVVPVIVTFLIAAGLLGLAFSVIREIGR
jgi:hypothetical protein